MHFGDGKDRLAERRCEGGLGRMKEHAHLEHAVSPEQRQRRRDVLQIVRPYVVSFTPFITLQP